MSNADKVAEARRKLLEKRLKAKRQSQAATPPSFPKHEDGAPIPATFGQQSLWYVQQIAPHSAAYNMDNVVRITGNLDVEALRESLNVILSRHEILRTNLAIVDGQLQQVIQDDSKVYFQVVPIASSEIDTAIREHIETPFDLENNALLRAILLQESDTDYVLVLVTHHIISDKWSLELLIWKEIEAVYSALVRGEKPNLSPVKAQFRDYTVWQQAKHETDNYQQKLAYWENHLADAPALLQLPLDYTRPPQQQFDGEVLYYTLPAELTTKLQELSREAGVTLFMTLLAAYFVLLHRMSRQDDVLVGTSVDMRTHAQLEQTIGYFLNTVVLRQRFDNDLSFRELLSKVKQTLLDAFANQDVEFEQLVQTMQLERDPSYNPLFQTMFVMWDANNSDPALPDLTLERYKIDPNIAKFDLTLYAQVNTDNTLLLALEYATALFAPETMSRLMHIYETLLLSVLDAPDKTITSLDWLPESQKTILLDEWTQTTQEYPREKRIHDFIASHDADVVAIRQADVSLSYGELNQRANQVAHYLIEQGVEPNTPVGLLVERSPEMLIGIVGVLKAGAAYVPIDPAYPTERIAFMLDDAGIAVLLTQAHLDSDMLDNIQRTNLDDIDTFATYSVDEPESVVTPDDLAYIIYTSGSTGQPKGVRATHRNLVHSTTARFSVYEHDIERFLLLSSFAFDSSLVGIFWTLCGGGTLCLPPHGAERDVAQIAGLIEKYQITHLLALPSLYSILLDISADHALNGLNTVIVAGEACPTMLVNAHYQLLPEAILYNEYGPTEGTVWATVSKIAPTETAVTIGKAIPNMQTYIVDNNLQPVPIGVAGELLIGGEGITQGYHNREQLTKERFITNPFGEGRLYRTGDLVQYRNDGNIEFLGRIDYQVKISGYRIELGEIENALSSLDTVQEAVVLTHDVDSITQLIGFLVGDVSVNQVRDDLQQRLPYYMIPRRLLALDAIPRTPNGKINRQALLALSSTEMVDTNEQPSDNRKYDDIEHRLITLWEELLGVSVTDVNSGFFALGGYSLLAIRMFARVKEEFDKDIPVSAIFEAPTIAKLADLLHEDDTVDPMIVDIKDGNRDKPLYLMQLNKFGVLYYRDLVDAINIENAIHGLVIPQYLDSKPIELIAQHLAEEVKHQNHAKQCYLLGISAAGVLAYETGRLLREAGWDVRVILVDTGAKNYPEYLSVSDAITQNMRVMAREFATSNQRDRVEFIRQHASVAVYRIRYQVRKRINWVLAKMDLPLLKDPDALLMREDDTTTDEMVRVYYQKDHRSDVPLLLYRTRLQPITSKHEWALKWDRIVDADLIEVKNVIGTHASLLKPPYLKYVVEHLEQWIEQQN